MSASKKMPTEEIKEILLHVVPDGWAKQAYLQGLGFDMKSYKATCDLFKIMEVAEQLYESGTTSKTPIRADNDSASHVRNLKGG